MRTFKRLLIVNDQEELVARYYNHDDKYHHYLIFELKRSSPEKWDEFDERSARFLDMMNKNSELF